jgi:hypothetical protein
MVIIAGLPAAAASSRVLVDLEATALLRQEEGKRGAQTP